MILGNISKKMRTVILSRKKGEKGWYNTTDIWSSISKKVFVTLLGNVLVNKEDAGVYTHKNSWGIKSSVIPSCHACKLAHWRNSSVRKYKTKVVHSRKLFMDRVYLSYPRQREGLEMTISSICYDR